MALPDLKALLRHPLFQVRLNLSGWELERNPVHIWRTIAVCTRHEMPLPPPVLAYLADVAQRMGEAQTAKDLRAVLPGIMGFSKGRGPGRLFDPGATDPDRLDLAVLFGIDLKLNPKAGVSEALRRAAERVSPAFANAHERTLKAWVVEALSLDPRPRTTAQWRSAVFDALDQHALSIISETEWLHSETEKVSQN
jgi:hypothetical protein